MISEVYTNMIRSTSLSNVTSWETKFGDDVYLAYSVCGAFIIVVCFIGVLSNGLNTFVLVRLIRRPSASPTYHLLLAMGVADLVAILFYLIYAVVMFARWKPLLFRDLTEDHSDFIHVLMRIWYFPVNIFLLASNWCVVAVTIFRFLAVTFPMKVNRWCTLWRVRLSIAIIFILALALNIPDWFTVAFIVQSNGRIRGNDTSLYSSLQAFYLVYQVLEIFIPFIVNLFLVIALIRNLYMNRRNLEMLILDYATVARKSEHRKIGAMLVLIVLFFLFCYAPKLITILVRELGPLGRGQFESNSEYMKAVVAADIFMLSNHAGNAALYCLCSKDYRKAFTLTLLCRNLAMHNSRYSGRHTQGNCPKEPGKGSRVIQKIQTSHQLPAP